MFFQLKLCLGSLSLKKAAISNDMGEITDLIISILGKAGRFLNARGKRVCFLIWLVCLSYWSVRNYYLGLKVQTASTVISAMLNVYGFIKWKKK